MDKIYTDPNVENDNTERIRRKRLSSILKAPRNPLDDLGNVNEITQDSHVERRRRSSRRVSFANTINCRVFQRDLKNSTSETENTGCSADEKDDTLTNHNEDPGAVPCEITGMNTLLHAPIQALEQQTEWHDVDHAALRMDRQDTTLLFSEENEMEITASHTAMISRNLRAHQPDRAEKIDFTSFLAKLNSSQGKADTNKELSLLSDPTNHPGPSLEQKGEATTMKKIDFNEFLLRLKSDNPAERPDKDDVSCVPSQGSGDVTRLSGEFGYSLEPLDTCNVTKVFRGREGGMEMTKCEAADVKIPFPGISDVPPEQWECVDVTEVFADEGVDVTTSHTAKVSFALSTVRNQSLNFQKDFPPTELDNCVFRRTSNHDLNVQQDLQLCADRKTANAEGRGDPPVLRAGKQEARALSAIQGSVSSENVFRGERTAVFSKCDDMEMSGNYIDITYEASRKEKFTEKSSSCLKTCEKLVSTNPLLAGSRSLACGNIPKGLASGDNTAAGPYKISALEVPSASGRCVENVSHDCGPAAATTGFGSYTHLVAGGVLKGRFDPSANPQLVFSGEKTVIFVGEDMDLAKICAKDGGENVDNEHPTAAFTYVTCKPHFLGNRSMSSNVTEQEEMEITRCHTVFFDGQSSGITAEPKQMLCKIIPRKSENKNVTEGDTSAYSVDMDKENIEVRSIDGNIKQSQAMERNAQDIWTIMVDKKLGKTNFQASGLSSCAKTMCLQEQNRGVPENVTNTDASLSLQSREVVSQPLKNNLPSPSDFCTNDTTGMFLGYQSMDITKAHPAAFEIAPINSEQESNNYNQNTALSKQLHNQLFPFSSHGVDIVSQNAEMECGDLKMNTSAQIVTALSPSDSFTFSNNPALSGMRGNEQFGTVIGVNADDQSSERQEKPQPVRAVSKVLPTQGDSDRHFSMGKTGSLTEGLKTPPSDGLLQRGAEEPLWARTSEAPKRSSQLSFFGEKSVLFPHGENMDMTGKCVVMVPDYSINVVLLQNKAELGCFGQGGNETMSLEKGAMTTMPVEQGGQEAAGGRTISFALAEDMEITTTHRAQHRQPISAISADKTIMFAHDQEDMDITSSHTVVVSKNIHEFETQQVPDTNIPQPPQHVHSGLVPCRSEMDSSHYTTKPKDKPSIPSSASSDSAFPSEKGATEVPIGTTPHSVYSVSLQESTVDVGAPQDHGLPTDNSVPVSREQDLTQQEKLQSKGVSFKLPNKGTVDHREESCSLGSYVFFPMQGSDPWKGHPDSPSIQGKQQVEEDSSQYGDSDSDLAEANLIPAANKESQKNEALSTEGEAPLKDFQINSEQTRQPLVSDISGDQAHPTLPSASSGILGVCSKLIDLTRKSVSVSKTASDQLPSSSVQPEDTLRLGKNTVSESNNFFDTEKQENTGLESGADLIGMEPKDKYPGINIPLGIFQPKLPNKRNRVPSAQDINTKSDRIKAPVPANTSETPGNKSSRQNFSPFQFIAEEFLPVYLEEMDSNESVSSELVENAWDDKNKKKIPHSEKGPFEETKTCNIKRALGQTEEALQSPKKAKKDQHVDAGASQGLEDQAEVDEAGESPHLSAKSPECPHASSSSSLDSMKADIESTIQRSSQVESQLLTDSICEENLWEKFQSGAITVGEFFTLLQVHVVIQKPRHSQLPASCAVSAPPTAEDLIYSQYIHRPKLRIYEEDCQDLSWKIVELKPHVTVLDQPLVSVIRSLWEVMRTCTDEELSKFGAELNKMKSCFTKEAKILSHNEKETLYRKLLQSAEEQYRKLKSRIEKVDDWMKEAESSMAALESEGSRLLQSLTPVREELLESLGINFLFGNFALEAFPASCFSLDEELPDSFWGEEEAGCSAGMAGGQNVQEELQSITAQEEELLRELSEMDAEDELDLSEIEKLKNTERACLEILKKYDFTEWELMEWSEQQAVFNFLYGSMVLTVVFGPPKDGEFFATCLSRSIISLDFESFLDEEQAPPSSCLVQSLIFQFIERQGSWQEKCPTLCYLPQALFDISLVVNRCKILGEELEFLQRWGAKFHLLDTDIKSTEVKLLFSSSVAFAKFELTLTLSYDYPSAVLPFRVQTLIGNIREKEIAAVLSRVPAGHHYLQRIVISIHQNLLQGPRCSTGSTGRTEAVKMGSL